jgi:crotonobetaine/carnitine-CoA ligase
MFPVSPRVREFTERFSVPVAAGYGSTEISAALLSKVGEAQPGLCGEALPHYEVQLMDEYDVTVARGEVGELVIRPREPYVMSHGYFKAPEKTAAAWTNLWFHTGDLFRFHEQTGQYEFIDRRKDVLRRRGENISAAEVERDLVALPYVQEAAVVAAPSAVGEDEIRAVIVPVPGAEIDPVDVLESMYAQLPYGPVSVVTVAEHACTGSTRGVPCRSSRITTPCCG